MIGLAVKIGLALLALAWGIWLGLPGRNVQTAADIEEAMERGGGRRRTTKRHFTPLAWAQRNISARGSGRGGRPRGAFKLESPEDR